MLSMLRSSDMLARLGGDEFGLLLPDCNIESARFISGRIISAINDYHFMWEGRLHRIGASAGITLIDEKTMSPATSCLRRILPVMRRRTVGVGESACMNPSKARLMLREANCHWMNKDTPLRTINVNHRGAWPPRVYQRRLASGSSRCV